MKRAQICNMSPNDIDSNSIILHSTHNVQYIVHIVDYWGGPTV